MKIYNVKASHFRLGELDELAELIGGWMVWIDCARWFGFIGQDDLDELEGGLAERNWGFSIPQAIPTSTKLDGSEFADF